MSRLSNPAIPLLGIYPQKLIFKNTKVRVHGGHCSTVHNNKNSKTPPLLPTLPHPRWDPESLRVTIKGFQEFCNVGSPFGIYLETLVHVQLAFQSFFAQADISSNATPQWMASNTRKPALLLLQDTYEQHQKKSRRTDMKRLIMNILQNGTHTHFCVF